jgi:hypothetical protein
LLLQSRFSELALFAGSVDTVLVQSFVLSGVFLANLPVNLGVFFMEGKLMGHVTGKVAFKALILAAAVASPMVFAADTDAVSTAVSSLQASTIANIGIVVTAAFAVLVAALVPDIGLGLAKKWIKKGAS